LGEYGVWGPYSCPLQYTNAVGIPT